jgi:hypothetical protein
MDRRPFSSTRESNATAACAALVAFAVAPLGSGCSFIFSEGPPEGHRALATFQCGESYAPPVLDAIGAGGWTLLAVSAAQNEDANVARSATPSQTRHDIEVAIGVTAAFAIIDAASAVYGYGAAGSCREAQDARRADLAAAAILPAPYGLPPNGALPNVWPPRLAPPPMSPAPAPAPSPPAPPLSPPSSPLAPTPSP